jgi:hypothetical protein
MRHYPGMSDYVCGCGYRVTAPADGARLCPVCSKGNTAIYCTERKGKGQRVKAATPAQIDELKRRFGA